MSFLVSIVNGFGIGIGLILAAACMKALFHIGVCG
jgi:hypothetical protein